ncbi:universal stress protein [Leisingera caerulea]|uniref:Universal stress protein n=1 Tax=Leisingera caerulea TaxID=506591 RepID=A0A9Q9HQB7_LEICA|nr:universal stress protein [Leisingera caerulea]UWQ52152.1 universal stress protein [Leisingera caerulea]UWQ56520.1 universal stress protein [Leisingera caerulea]UWQ64838.1 universal stress protein [Leisingera caerulea]
MTERILVATDGSASGNRAVDCAAELSNKLGRGLSIVHVYLHGRPAAEMMQLARSEQLYEQVAAAQDLTPRGQPANFLGLFASATEEREKANAILAIGETILNWAEHRAKDAGAQDVVTHLSAGDYADGILKTAELENAGMIVIGRRGLGQVREILMGSVSQKVLHHAACTVVVTQ